MGGGVSVGAHIDGKVVDVFNALDGDGAFSPERAGAVPSGALIRMCYSGKYSEKEAYKKICGNGGFNAYLGTNDMREVSKRANEGDEKAKAVKDAFIYQIGKDIGSMACVLEGKVDCVVGLVAVADPDHGGLGGGKCGDRQGGDHHKRQKDTRERCDDITDTHQDSIKSAPDIAGKGAQQCTEKRTDRDDSHADQDGGAAADCNAGKNISAKMVTPEQMRKARRRKNCPRRPVKS